VWDDVRLLPKGYDLRLPHDLPGADARVTELARRAGQAAPLTERRYRVRRGDTLSGIAARHGLSTRQLAAHNGLSPTAQVRVAQVLKLPAQSTVSR
jgi:LysM repeat protein